MNVRVRLNESSVGRTTYQVVNAATNKVLGDFWFYESAMDRATLLNSMIPTEPTTLQYNRSEEN
jgi:hypothetical protein